LQHTVLILTALLALGGCSKSADSGTTAATPQASETPAEGRGERRRARYEAMLKEMDKDGDGKLSEAEKSAGFDAAVARSERYRNRVDTDGDGKVSAAEKSEGLKRFMRPRQERERREED
jgi:hypothetical protein